MKGKMEQLVMEKLSLDSGCFTKAIGVKPTSYCQAGEPCHWAFQLRGDFKSSSLFVECFVHSFVGNALEYFIICETEEYFCVSHTSHSVFNPTFPTPIHSASDKKSRSFLCEKFFLFLNKRALV